MITSLDFDIVWQQAIVAYFNVLSTYLHEGTEYSYEKRQDIRPGFETGIPENERGTLRTRQ
jgi:hypothetical protein